MRPSIGEDGEPGVLVLESRSDGLSVDGARARPDDHWPATDRVMFLHAPSELLPDPATKTSVRR
ncbi:MAG: hypothetical protein M3256_27545 [Actinomycetota bacterium]|nr:hypothetical protein [Actinomycetota bacterium]